MRLIRLFTGFVRCPEGVIVLLMYVIITIRVMNMLAHKGIVRRFCNCLEYCCYRECLEKMPCTVRVDIMYLCSGLLSHYMMNVAQA